VPNEILVSNNETISGDGSIHLKKKTKEQIITCSSVNRKLLEGVSVLLDRLGIRHHVDKGFLGKHYKGKYPTQICYKLSIQYGLSVNKFMKLIGFIQHRLFLPRTHIHEALARPAHIVRIRSIEYIGEEPVYEISTASENFVAGGMLCHNTGTPQAMIGGLVVGHSGGGGPMMMGGSGGGGTVQMRFDPNPSPISVSYDTQSRGFNYVPAYYISKRVNICITSQYTISSRGAGGTVSQVGTYLGAASGGKIHYKQRFHRRVRSIIQGLTTKFLTLNNVASSSSLLITYPSG
jgi:hypothetical protein